MKKPDYDLIIIGGGPGGLTAGLYASRARLNVILFEKIVTGGQILVTDWIENYPGFPQGISGSDLADKMAEQAKKFGLAIESNEVISLDLSDPLLKKVKLSDKTVTCSAIIICTGASPKKMNVTGEDKFYGRGVSFCATCDGPFFKDKTVIAVGGGDTAVQESVFLTKFAKKIYLIHRRDQLRASKILQERAFADNKIEFVWDSAVTQIHGTDNVEKVKIKNLKTGIEKELQADGIFVWIGILPNTEFLKGSPVKTDEAGFIIADMKMETSVPGVFAAGDVRNTPLRQIATAIGDAATAAYSAEHYISAHSL